MSPEQHYSYMKKGSWIYFARGIRMACIRNPFCNISFASSFFFCMFGTMKMNTQKSGRRFFSGFISLYFPHNSRQKCAFCTAIAHTRTYTTRCAHNNPRSMSIILDSLSLLKKHRMYRSAPYITIIDDILSMHLCIFKCQTTFVLLREFFHIVVSTL